MPKTAQAAPKRAQAVGAKGPVGPWWELAECGTADPEVFFPLSGSGAAAHHEIARAKAICRSCTVCEPCLNYALDTRQAHGVWGGRSEEERRTIVMARQRALRQ
jgi:WhiB family redox-sensing transcriptional regulator